MRKSFLPAVLASTLLIGGCASGYGQNPLGTILGSVLGGGGYGTQNPYGNQGFQQAAVQACGSYASRYGRVGIADVRQQSRSTLRVYGTIENGYQRRNFACSFRSDGRITDFDLG